MCHMNQTMACMFLFSISQMQQCSVTPVILNCYTRSTAQGEYKKIQQAKSVMIYTGHHIYEGYNVRCFNVAMLYGSFQCIALQKETFHLTFHWDLGTLYSLVKISRGSTVQYCTICYWSLIRWT